MTHTSKPAKNFQSSPIALADRLIRTLGYPGALRACRENHWAGVEVYLQRNASIRN